MVLMGVGRLLVLLRGVGRVVVGALGGVVVLGVVVILGVVVASWRLSARFGVDGGVALPRVSGRGGRYGGRLSSRSTVLGSWVLNVESADVFWVVLPELVLEPLVLLELVLDVVVCVGLGPEPGSGHVPASWKVSFNSGRLFGDVLRTTVGSRGGRNMALDILWMPDIKVDFVSCSPGGGLGCSTVTSCSEASIPISVWDR
jgi:hypothetical protein